jgi:type IV pilus assembly protein PilO
MDPRIEKVVNLPLYQRLLLLGSLVAAIAGLYVYLVYLPKMDTLSSLNEQNKTLAAKLQQDQRIANNLPKFKAEYEKMNTRLDEALTELPNDREIPTLLTNIAGLARESGLEVNLFKPGKEIPKGFYAEVPVTLKLNGTYHELGRFAYEISRLSRIVNLNGLNLKSPKIDDGRTLLSVDCTATTFRFLPQDKAQK